MPSKKGQQPPDLSYFGRAKWPAGLASRSYVKPARFDFDLSSHANYAEGRIMPHGAMECTIMPSSAMQCST
jgi:hypothetical protein